MRCKMFKTPQSYLNCLIKKSQKIGKEEKPKYTTSGTFHYKSDDNKRASLKIYRQPLVQYIDRNTTK